MRPTLWGRQELTNDAITLLHDEGHNCFRFENRPNALTNRGPLALGANEALSVHSFDELHDRIDVLGCCRTNEEVKLHARKPDVSATACRDGRTDEDTLRRVHARLGTRQATLGRRLKAEITPVRGG